MTEKSDGEEGTEKSNGSAANTMRERAGESRLKLWLLLGANRLLITGVVILVIFFVFVLAVTALSPPFVEQLESKDVIESMFGTMITVVVTGTTLVVTIGQLVLTQENGPLGDQRDRMNNSMEVRAFLEELIGKPPSPDPSAFLSDILGVTIQRSEALRTAVREANKTARNDGGETREIESLTQSVIENAETVREQLEDTQFGSFDVLFAALNFNYSWKIAQTERIEHEYEERLTEDEHDALEELQTVLSVFAPAREHIKTLYFQWALIDLSRQILYAAIPAVIVAGVMLAGIDVGSFPGSTAGIDHVVLVVGGAFAVTLIPFVLFVSYVLRILTIAKRTLAIEPLILRDSQR